MGRPHLHPEIELNLVLSGGGRYAVASGGIPLPVGRLVAFWGGYPRSLIVRDGAFE